MKISNLFLTTIFLIVSSLLMNPIWGWGTEPDFTTEPTNAGGISEVGKQSTGQIATGSTPQDCSGTSSTAGNPTAGNPYLSVTAIQLNNKTLSRNFAILVFSIVILVVGLFFLFEASKIYKWIFGEQISPNSNSGVIMSVVVAAIVAFAWIIRTIKFDLFPNTNLLDYFIYYPLEFVPGFLLASIVPTCMGFIKLGLVILASPHQIDNSNIKMTSLSIVYLVAGFVNFAASIATLYTVFGTRLLQ